MRRLPRFLATIAAVSGGSIAATATRTYHPLTTHLTMTADRVRSARTPVRVDLVGDDGLTQNLSHGLRAALGRATDLRLAEPTDGQPIFITSDSNVDWDETSAGTVIIYAVHVFRGGDAGAPIVGRCRERAVHGCVRAILRLVRAEASASGHSSPDHR